MAFGVAEQVLSHDHSSLAHLDPLPVTMKPPAPEPSSIPIATPSSPTRPIIHHVSDEPAMPTSPTRTSPRRMPRAGGENAEAGPSRSPMTAEVHRSPKDVDGSLFNPYLEGSEDVAPAAATSPVPPPAAIEEDGPQFLQPDSFYPLNNGAKPSNVTGTLPKGFKGYKTVGGPWLSPEDDPLALRGIPIFKPTMEEFKDFEGYVEKTVPWGMRSGIIKVVPPKEWIDTLPPMDRRTLAHVQIKNPIQQNMMGTGGVFRQTNIEKNKNRPLSVHSWFDKCQDEKFVGPSPHVYERDSKEAKEVKQMKLAAMQEKREVARRKREEKEKRKSVKVEEELKEEEEMNSAPLQGAAGTDKMDVDDNNDLVPPLDPPSGGSSHSSPDPMAKTPETDDDVEPWYHNIDLKEAWLPKNTKPEDYTPEACRMLQDKFWKNLGWGEPSWYGADLMQGSLFAKKETPWNVAHLPNLLNRINTIVPGVNEPYLYFGMWRAAFAWHVEDMDLFSINYIHFGAPKFWYAIPQGQAELFERRLREWFPHDAQQCDQFLRHKACAISPTQLEKNGIRANMLVHNQGEFVITYPRGYHAGFNMGFNCAESVNFALESWIELGKKAKYCQCVSHSVRINVDKMLEAAEDAVAQPEGVYNEKRGGDDLEKPTPSKRPRKKKIPEPHVLRDGNIIDNIHEIPATSRISADHVISLDQPSSNEIIVVPTPKKRVRKPKASSQPVSGELPVAPPQKIRITVPKPVHPCLFCPNTTSSDLIPIFDPNDVVRAHGKNAQTPLQAHLACVQAIPNTGVEMIEVDGVQKEMVVGANDIEKARWNLKCTVCDDKSLASYGVKIQCTKGKCPRAFHVTCAQNSDEVEYKLLEVGEQVRVPEVPEDQEGAFVEHVFLKAEVLCPQHNPAMKEIRERKKAEDFKNKVMSLIPGEGVKIKQSGGSFKMILVAVHEASRRVEVELDNNKTAMYSWDKIDFRAGEGKMQENEYARVHTHSRKPGAAKPSTIVPTGTNAQNAARPPIAGPSTGFGPAHHQVQPVQPSLAAAVFTRQTVQPFHQSQVAPASAKDVFRHYAPQPGFISGSIGTTSARPPNLISSYNANWEYRPPPTGDGYNQNFRTDSRLEYHYDYSGQPPTGSRPVSGQSRPSLSYQNPAGMASLPTNGPPHPGAAPNAYRDPQPRYPSGLQHPSPQMNQYHPQSQMQRMHPPHPSTRYISPNPQQLSNQPHKQYQPNPWGGAPSPVTHPTPLQRSHETTTSHLQGSGYHTIPSQTAPVNHTTAQDKPLPSVGSTGRGKIDLGIARMTRLMAALPRLTIPAIHLAGTNGKGSVSAMLETCLISAGLTVGRYNSPYLLEPRDAIRIGGQPVDLKTYNAQTAKVQNANTTHNLESTTFELATAAAFAIFQKSNVDVMLIECGMGGARDATNVIPPNLTLASGLTAVGLDHTAFLGDTVQAIATEKSKIAVQGGLLVVAPQPYSEVYDTAGQVARSQGARIVIAQRGQVVQPATMVTLRTFKAPSPPAITTSLPSIPPQSPPRSITTRLNLPGDHQIDNLSLALTILHSIRMDSRALTIQPKLKQLSDQSIQSGIENTSWPGRLSWTQWRSRNPHTPSIPILVDGAHNNDSAQTLRRYLDSQGIFRVRWIIGLSDSPGKTIESVLNPLIRYGDSVYIVNFDTPLPEMPWIKNSKVEDVARVCAALAERNDPANQGRVSVIHSSGVKGIKEAVQGLRVLWERDMSMITGVAGEERIANVLCGSLYLVAEYYRALEG